MSKENYVALGVDFGSSSIVVTASYRSKDEGKISFTDPMIEKTQIFIKPNNGEWYVGDEAQNEYDEYVLINKAEAEKNFIYSYKRFIQGIIDVENQTELNEYMRDNKLTYEVKIDNENGIRDYKFNIIKDKSKKYISLKDVLDRTYDKILEMIKKTLENKKLYEKGKITKIEVCYTRPVLVKRPYYEFVSKAYKFLESYVEKNKNNYENNGDLIHFYADYEPVSAIYRYVRVPKRRNKEDTKSAKDKMKKFKHFLVFDYGACTLDIACVTSTSNGEKGRRKYTVNGDYCVGKKSGGDDLDLLLANSVKNKYVKEITLLEAKEIKEKVSSPTYNDRGEWHGIRITKEFLIESVKEKVDECVDELIIVLDRFIREHAISKKDILVYISGGASAIPCMKDVINEKIGKFKDTIEVDYYSDSIDNAKTNRVLNKCIDVARGASIICSNSSDLGVRHVENIRASVLFKCNGKIFIARSGHISLRGINGNELYSENGRVKSEKDFDCWINID